jgi:hypothetical protein
LTARTCERAKPFVFKFESSLAFEKNTGSSVSSDPGSPIQPQDRTDLSIAMKANFWAGAHSGRNEGNR